MHQQIDKKHRYILLIILFLFLTTVSNLRLNKNIDNLPNIKNIEVVGLSDNLNQKIKERISFVINQDIFFISENYIKESLDELATINFDLSNLSNRLVGMNGDGIKAILGFPAFKRSEPPARIWQYRTQVCIANVFLWFDLFCII